MEQSKPFENEGPVYSILNEIGVLIHGLSGGDDRAFLYSEVEAGMIAPSLFIERLDFVEYAEPSHDLSMKLYDLWNAAPEGKRWGAISYALAGEKVKVEFTYPEDWAEDEFTDDRLDRILERRFAGRRIVYPQLPDAGSDVA